MERIITDRDLLILQFVNTYKSITINICSKIFYQYTMDGQPISQGHTLARKELKKLTEMGELKYTQDKRSNQRIFYTSEKPLSSHNLLILDFLAELLSNGAKIEMFNVKCTDFVKDFKLKPDAVIKYAYKSGKDLAYLYHRAIFLECVLTNYPDLVKYEIVYNSREINNFGMIPLLVIVDSQVREIKSKVVAANTIFLDYKLNGFKEKIMPYID